MPKACAGGPKKAYTRAQNLSLKDLNLKNTADKHAVIRMLRKIYDPINPFNPQKLFFQKKDREDFKKRLGKALKDRNFLNKLPECLPKGNIDDLAEKLYILTRNSHTLRDWGDWGLPKRDESVSSVSSVASTPPRALNREDDKPFDYARATVLPNIDIQIIRPDSPTKTVAYRLSDFVRDEWQLSARSTDGNWLDGARLNLERLKTALAATKHIRSRDDTLWWNPWPLHIIDSLNLTMQTAEDGEILLTDTNFLSTLQRVVETHFPDLSPEKSKIGEGFLEVRPNITLIVRSEGATGGAFSTNYESNLSSPGPLRSATSNPSFVRGQTTSDPNRFSTPRKERVGSNLDPDTPLQGHRHSSPPRKEPIGAERFSLPRNERPAHSPDSGFPFSGPTPKYKPAGPSCAGSRSSLPTSHWLEAGPGQGDFTSGPFISKRKETMPSTSSDRDLKRRKLDYKIQAKLQELGSRLMEYITEYGKNRFLVEHVNIATQFLNTLTPRFENYDSSETEKHMCDFFETAVVILGNTASMAAGQMSEETLSFMTTLLNKILTSIGDLDADESDEPILSPSADMAILILDSLFGKVEKDTDEEGLNVISTICYRVLSSLIDRSKSREDQRQLTPVFQLAYYLVREIDADLAEMAPHNSDPHNAQSHIGHLLGIGTSITIKIHDKVNGGPEESDDEDEDDETWAYNVTAWILVLSIERMMDGLKDGTAEQRINRRCSHVCNLLERTEDSPIIQFSAYGYKGLSMALIHMTKQMFGPGEGDLLEQVIVLLEQLAPVFQLHGSTMAKIQTEMTAEPEVLDFMLESGAMIYNEVMLELRQSGAEFIPLANAVSDFTKFCSLFLECIREGEADGVVNADEAQQRYLKKMVIWLDSLSTMHQSSNKGEGSESGDANSASSEGENSDKFEPPILQRSDTISNFYRSFSDLQRRHQYPYEGPDRWVADQTELQESESYLDRLENLLKFIEGVAFKSTADNGNVTEWKFDPDQSALCRTQGILGFLRTQTESSLASTLLQPDDGPGNNSEGSDEGSDEDDEEEEEE